MIYRAYIIDEAKTFKSFNEFKADDDGDALRKAERLIKGNSVELWAGLVGTLKPARQRTAALV
jgi:hypothetical protein